jgi:competence protein ComEC
MWIGMLSCAFAQLWLAPALLLNALDAYLLAYVATIARWSAGAPGAVLDAKISSIAGLGAAYLVLAAAMGALFRLGRAPGRRLRAPLVAALAVLLAVGALLSVTGSSGGEPPGRFTATFLDVGQGDATLFQAPGATVLVDGGPPEGDVVSMLRRHGVSTLDVVVLTHAQRDHEGGLEAVVRGLPVRLLLDGGGHSRDSQHDRIVATARSRGARVLEGQAGQALTAGPLRIRVLSPSRVTPGAVDPDEDPNLRALVLVVSYRGLDFFMPADAESEVTGALALPPGVPDVEVLKVAHHGSADEGLGSLLGRLRPEVAVVEVGEGNPYGHPDPRTIAALVHRVPRVYRTDRDGEVRVSQ